MRRGKGGFMMIKMMTDDNDNYNYLRKVTHFFRGEILILAAKINCAHEHTHTHTLSLSKLQSRVFTRPVIMPLFTHKSGPGLMDKKRLSA